jgi:predicted RND superfamily exporter protein
VQGDSAGNKAHADKASGSERELPRALAWLAAAQARWPYWFILLAILTLFPSGWATSQLKLKPDFSELLPDNKDSVVEMRRVSARLAGSGTLSIVAQIDDGSRRQALRTFVDTLVPKLRAIGPKWVGSVEYGVRDTQAFFDLHKLLYADLADLKKAHDQITERYDWEVAKAQGTLLDEDDPPQPINAESLERTLREKSSAKKSSELPAYPGGYYEAADGKYAAILIKTPVSGRAAVHELVQKVESAVREVNPERFDPTLRVGYTGDVITGQEEYDAIVNDLSHVGASGIAGVLISVLLFFLRVRTVLTMGGTLLIGLLWTFGLTHYTIGYLNSSTGFLVSIIAGNGINYGIMYMARYIEARRDERLDVGEAVHAAHRDSWIPTLASAATAALAYGSLIVTDFRGFKHFGVIGGYGMILCWLTTYAFMPALLVASERVWPAFRANAARSRARGYYGVLFAKLALSAPRAISVVGAVIAIVSIALSVRYFQRDPMEYNMKNVRTDSAASESESGARELSAKVDQVVGRLGQEGLAIMTDRLDQVPMLMAELEKRWQAAPAELKPFQRVVSIYSLLPSDQAEKIPLLEAMRSRLERARQRQLISDADWQKLAPHLPSGEIRPLGIDDLPEQVARAFTERDGTRGRIVYIAPTSGQSVWDAKYLMRWADSFRYVTLPNGEVIKGSGRAVIFADMIRTVGEDAPKAIAVSALGTIAVILVAFRGSMLSFGVFLPWLVGISTLIGFLYLRDIRLNFLNFVAIPITIGIGAEYAHNVMQRYRFEGAERLRHVITETGGAVTLCSLTTTIGYLALLMSINRGIRGFGLAAAVGEITCLCAAVLWLPALLVWRARRLKAKTSALPPPLTS